MKVLIPVQDDLFGDALVDLVLHHKWSSDTEFHLLTVLDFGAYGNAGDVYCCEYSHRVLIERKEAAALLLQKYADLLSVAVPGAKITDEIAFGDPKEHILTAAKKLPADLIILGAHSKTKLVRFLLGSVSSAVLAESPCTVMVLKLPRQTEKVQERGSVKTTATTLPAGAG